MLGYDIISNFMLLEFLLLVGDGQMTWSCGTLILSHADVEIGTCQSHANP